MTCTSIKLEFWINTRPSSGCHINNSETLEFKCLQLGTIANEHVGNVEYSTSFRLNKEVNYLLNEINFKPVLRSKNMKKGNIQGVIAALLCITYFESSVHSQATVNPHERDTRSAAPCAVNYVKQGCFNDKTNPSQRTMSELLFQDRYKGKTFSGQKIDWNNWKTYLPELICRCAKAADNKGYEFFGIQHYGECWSSADAASRFHIYGPNDKCINNEFKSCDNLASDEACSGVNYANYVYEIFPRVLRDAPCAVNYLKQGCFNDKTKPSQRTMSELLFQDRHKGKTFSGQKIDWNNWKTYLPELICRCAKAAGKKGYEFFGIQHYGECWSSADAASRFHIYGPNDKCINNEFKSCDNLASDEACSGVNYANYVYEIFPHDIRSAAPCAVNYAKQGCFNDKTKPSQRTMSELLFQDRYKGKTFSGQKIDWNNWKTYLPELICRCAKAAGNKGYEFFGIQHYGECWSSADAASRFHIYGPNDKCINNEFKSCDNLASDEACSGVNYANYVYEISPESPGGSGVGLPINPEEY
ncbi:uncharacterized protein LOC114976229 isoform X3 [Acropora millepora]|uniref:uncharacterized protein LOC114976229 isoform X3 n=1 Tax=Acropora millepora TaxID=45264 RepID=UPI001CF39266|nr:uncharacterized protein LOC114976229 isoform X3 [Acropora millepora]